MHKHLSQYNKSNVGIARLLRRRMTDAEKKLWSIVRNNQLGVKFRRQVPFDEYVLDYYCASVKLNVELDGSQHYTEDAQLEDNKRDDKLREAGIRVLRFSSADTLQNPEGVEQAISYVIYERLKQTPSPEGIPSGLTFP
ncbi:MAG TPA: endonuclease domain-containing protein [Bacteroidota bacterium]